jgi:hypothetical protein
MVQFGGVRPLWGGRVVGVAALFSGVALLCTILFEMSLPLGLLTIGGTLGVLTAVALARLPQSDRARVRSSAISGVTAGLVATLFYDVVKSVLSTLDPSPYNPFEAFRIFGELLLGPGAPTTMVHTAGVTLHVINGSSFGVAYAVLLGAEGGLSARAALARGLGWAVFLEMFQLTLYPGWLDIRAYEEFVAISALAHLAYGVVLGLLCRALARRLLEEGDR